MPFVPTHIQENEQYSLVLLNVPILQLKSNTLLHTGECIIESLAAVYCQIRYLYILITPFKNGS